MFLKPLKRTISVCLALLLLLTAAPLAGLEGLDLFPQAEAAYSVGATIQYGNYPQTKVEETDALRHAASGATWMSYNYYIGTAAEFGNDVWNGQMTPSDYMQFADFFCDDVEYRAVKFSVYRPNYTGLTSSADHSRQDDNGYNTDTTYYFKYEPLTWRVLDPHTGYIMCESIIDAQAYQNTVYAGGGQYYQANGSSVYASDYAASSIREWLNKDFYETAFTTPQKANIETATLVNGAQGSGGHSSESTSDKIFLLSWSDAVNHAYGFNSNYSSYDSARRATGTDYAKCQGLYVETDPGFSGFSMWWLRSPGISSRYACCVSIQGFASSGTSVNDARGGIRPACILTNLESDVLLSDDLYSEPHVHTPGQAVVENEVAATCSTAGSCDEVVYCSDCGEELSREHKELPIAGHTDEDNDGLCDFCEKQMTGGNHCKYCGQIHTGFGGFFTKIIHWFKALFGQRAHEEMIG